MDFLHLAGVSVTLPQKLRVRTGKDGIPKGKDHLPSINFQGQTCCSFQVVLGSKVSLRKSPIEIAGFLFLMVAAISIPVAFPSAILATKTRQKNNKVLLPGENRQKILVLDCFCSFSEENFTQILGVFLDIKTGKQRRFFLFASSPKLLCHGSRLSERRETSCGMLSRKSMFFFCIF